MTNQSLDKIINNYFKASVSEIVSTLIPYPYKLTFKMSQRGNGLHYRLGYTNTEVFSRFMYVEDSKTLIRIYGTPDKLDYKTATVHELKTTKNGISKDRLARAKAQLTLYIWLTNMIRGSLDIYHWGTGELEVGYIVLENNQSVKEHVEYLVRNYVAKKIAEEDAKASYIKEVLSW